MVQVVNMDDCNAGSAYAGDVDDDVLFCAEDDCVKATLVVRSSFAMETNTSKPVWCPGKKAVQESTTQVCRLKLAVLTTGSRL
jgi:hypothetical protein